MYKPIGDYGIIGDMNSAALVGTDGAIDWCCFPRFDSPSVFAAILDDQKGGTFQITPDERGPEVHQSYLPNTNILHTQFKTSTGELSLTDFMPVDNTESSGSSPHEIHRIVRCTGGTVDVRCLFQPRLDYARTKTSLDRVKGGVIARGNHQVLTLSSQVPLQIGGDEASAQFTLEQGETAPFVLAYGADRPQTVQAYDSARKLERTRAHWEAIVSNIKYDGLWKDELVRSLLVLHLLIYWPTGAIIAAPTTSLPEGIGGSRNWDYRYTWLRDSSFTMDALYRVGDVEGATRYRRWLLDKCKVGNGRTKSIYGISQDSSLKEKTLDGLDGYRSSRPVRIGNDAAGHLQLDVYGEVILGLDAMSHNGAGDAEETWSLVANFADVVSRKWRQKDRGVWEVRGAPQHFVYSKVMCWVALERAAAMAAGLKRTAEAHRWAKLAGVIKEEILKEGWNESKASFAQFYGGDGLDASNLMIPFVRFLPPDDPRVLSTIDAIRKELADGPFVRRYIPQVTDDGLGGEEEGSFTILSFWLIGNLIYTGRTEKAQEYFEEIMSCANHLGLFAEMIDPRTRELMGNFPQAYSHIGLIHSVLNLNRASMNQHTPDARKLLSTV